MDKKLSDMSEKLTILDEGITECNNIQTKVNTVYNNANTLTSTMNNKIKEVDNKLNAINDAFSSLVDNANNAINNVASSCESELTELRQNYQNHKTALSNDVNYEIIRLNKLLKDVEQIKEAIISETRLATIEQAYPVGAVFISLSSVSPNTQLGVPSSNMTWRKLSSGYHLKTGSFTPTSLNSNKTSGSSYITLTPSVLPKHRHTETYAGDNGEYGDWIVLRSDSEVQSASANNTLNFSTTVYDGYTDDVSRYWSSATNVSGRKPRKLYTGPNIEGTSESVRINNAPLSMEFNMWVRVS